MQNPTQTSGEVVSSPDVYEFWRDPVCLASWALYLLNRFVWVPRFGHELPFLSEHLDDLLLVPAALPPFVWARQCLGLRHVSGTPTVREVGVVTFIASVVFEWLGPKYLGHSVGDWNDVAVYWLGALFGGGWWTLVRFKGRSR
ncbi:hypothetical protein IAD21_05675 [Abditibacteriota bacterium]|nr:hypothetical protein IAD21_05675 [Abditibacteriota bacterium]